MAPCRIHSVSLPCPFLVLGAFTLSTRSAEPRTEEPAGSTDAPASPYPASGKPAESPAPDSTEMVYPAWMSFLQDSGTSATRRSPGQVSFGTPIRMVFVCAYVLASNRECRV